MRNQMIYKLLRTFTHYVITKYASLNICKQQISENNATQIKCSGFVHTSISEMFWVLTFLFNKKFKMKIMSYRYPANKIYIIHQHF
jgi:hypothetical protein